MLEIQKNTITARGYQIETMNLMLTRPTLLDVAGAYISRRLGMSTLRTNALEGVDAKNSITIVAGAGNITTTNVQEGLAKSLD